MEHFGTVWRVVEDERGRYLPRAKGSAQRYRVTK